MLISVLTFQSILGFFVVSEKMKVGYSRKIVHFLIHSLPVLFVILLPSYEIEGDSFEDDTTLEDKMSINELLWQQVLVIFYLGSLTKPLRRGSSILLLSFRSIDRPEDRPYTLAWIASQTIWVYIFVCCMFMWLLTKSNKLGLVFLPLIVSNIGDGLAEPVGLRFGKHKYKTRALWYDGKFCTGSFTRSIEGSAAVFLVTVVTVIGYYLTDYFTATQFIAAMLIMPIGFTLGEAFSPHTWDNPFIVAIGFFFTWFCLDVVR